MISFGKYTKFIVAAVGALVIILTAALGANSPVLRDVIAVATALGVYVGSNAA